MKRFKEFIAEAQNPDNADAGEYHPPAQKNHVLPGVSAALRGLGYDHVSTKHPRFGMLHPGDAGPVYTFKHQSGHKVDVHASLDHHKEHGMGHLKNKVIAHAHTPYMQGMSPEKEIDLSNPDHVAHLVSAIRTYDSLKYEPH